MINEMTDHTKETVEVELQRGGVIEYAKTGIYPEYLLVRSKKWDRRWRKSISGDKKEGVLYMNKKPKYRYRVTGHDIKIHDMDGNPVEIESLAITMAD